MNTVNTLENTIATYLGCILCGYIHLPHNSNELLDEILFTRKCCPKCNGKLQMFDLNVEVRK